MACELGHTEIANLLLKSFPHLITYQSKDGNTPLHLAASHGHIDVMNALLNFRYDFKSYSNDEAIVNILEVDKIEVVTSQGMNKYKVKSKVCQCLLFFRLMLLSYSALMTL